MATTVFAFSWNRFVSVTMTPAHGILILSLAEPEEFIEAVAPRAG